VIRLLGFLIGSAASLGAILLILGVPDVNLSQPAIDVENTESAVQLVEELTVDIADEIADETADVIADDLPVEKDLKWHAFWNPFRSRIAAEGFVGQLEKVTGLDYRVIKIETGVYEVAFGYENEAEREDKMSFIASATGLDLPQS
jgi:hypothetical protein